MAAKCFLESTLNKAVEQRTKDAIEKHLHTPLGQRSQYIPFTDGQDFDEGDEIERPLEIAPDTGPGPEALCIQDEEEKASLPCTTGRLRPSKAACAAR